MQLESTKKELFEKGILDADKEKFLLNTIKNFADTTNSDRFKYQIEDQGALLTAFGYDGILIEQKNPNEDTWKYLNLLNRTTIITTN